MNVNRVATKEVADHVPCGEYAWLVHMFHDLVYVVNQSQFCAARTATEVASTRSINEANLALGGFSLSGH